MMADQIQAPLSIRLLGAVQVRAGEAPLDVDTRKAIALLAYLAIEGSAQSRETLMALLWPESDTSHARASLRRTLSVLRRHAGELIRVERDTIDLSRERIELDVTAFRSALAEQRAHSHPPHEVCEACLESLAAAIDLAGSGNFMDGFTLRDSDAFTEWQRLQGEQLRRELSGALIRVVRGYSERADYRRAIEYAQRWIALEPLSEPAHRALMSLYGVTGDRASAIRQYRECVRVLQDELGVTPLPQTSELYHEIMGREAGAESLSPPDPASETRRTGRRRAAGSAPQPFVGRERELNALREALQSVARSGHLAVIEGEAGAGKTRLVEELLAEIPQAPLLVARCYEEESELAYAPVTAMLRQLTGRAEFRERIATLPTSVLAETSRLLPEMAALHPGIGSPPPMEAPGTQIRFFECIGELMEHALSGGRAGVLWVEDAHWADRASAELFSFLVRRLASSRSLIIVTWRGEELAHDHPLRRLLAARQREEAATRIRLGRLGEGEVRALLAARGGGGVPIGHLARRLHEETEGLPLFIQQYLASLDDLIDLPDDAPESWPIPETVREVLRQRLQRVSEPGRQLLSTAAVIGRECSFEILREASGRDADEVVGTLEELAAGGLLRQRAGADHDEPRYDFAHDKLRVLIHEETSLARRRLLHGRVAEALQRRAGGARTPASHAGEIARHYERAGQADRAAAHFRDAGDRARAVYANAEALAHYRAALALSDQPSTSLHMSIGELQTLAGDYRSALESYEIAAAYAGSDELPRIDHTTGNLYRRIGQWALADQHYRAAAEALEAPTRTDEPRAAQLSRVYADWSLSLHRQGDGERAEHLARHALGLAEAADDTMARAEAHNMLGILARARGDIHASEQRLRESLALAEAGEAIAPRIAALNNLALALLAAGKVSEAESHARLALELCQKLGDRHREAALHGNLADILHAGEDVDASMSHLKEAAGLFAQIGQEWGELQPEIWKLTEW